MFFGRKSSFIHEFYITRGVKEFHGFNHCLCPWKCVEGHPLFLVEGRAYVNMWRIVGKNWFTVHSIKMDGDLILWNPLSPLRTQHPRIEPNVVCCLATASRVNHQISRDRNQTSEVVASSPGLVERIGKGSGSILCSTQQGRWRNFYRAVSCQGGS